tara:strand:- start:420 stop:815 length:396 start_codon:yes stop_codon:yes gene_type:complete
MLEQLKVSLTETTAMNLPELIDQILAFRDERDWEQFHTPKHLASALGIEVAELQELMLWKNDQEISDLIDCNQGHREVSDEIADILIYSLLFCKSAGIDPEAAIRIKLKKNAEKYPVEEARGNATKYTNLT